MGLIGLRARSECRRHWLGLVALTVAVGFVGTVVLTAASGARRTRSSVTRLDQSTRALNWFTVFTGGDTNYAQAVAALPAVEDADRFSAMSFFNEQGQLPILASIDGHMGRTVQRDRVLRGRRPNQAAALEVGMSEPVAQHLHLDVGDDFPLTGISPEQSACVFGQGSQGDPRCEAFQKAFYGSPADFSAFAGPRVTLRVVGITRGINDIAARPDDMGAVFLTAAFYRKYHDVVALTRGMGVRLRPGTTSKEFEDAVARVVPKDALQESSDNAAAYDGLQSTVGVLANGLLAFAAVAALAGFAAIALAFSRRVGFRSAERAVLRSLGMSSRGLVIDSCAPLVPVAVAGAALSVLGAWLSSALMPIGTARRVEPHPGVAFDFSVLAVGGVLIAVGVISTAALCGLLAVRRSAQRSGNTHATGVWTLTSVTATIGSHLAFDNVRRRGGVPLRSAVSGVVLGVAGVLAVSTFGAGLTRLGQEPARSGWPWDVVISGERASDPDTPEPLPGPASDYWDRQAARIVKDPDVAGVAQMWFGFQTRVAGRGVTAFAQRPYQGETGFAVIAGHAPLAVDEVALGAKTMRRGNIQLGDRVRVADRTMQVVGQAIFPATGDNYALADGALFSARGFDALGLGNSSGLGIGGSNGFAVELRDGADHGAAIARLKTLNKGDAPQIANRPAEVAQLEQLDRLPIFLAAFLLVVALLALGHAIVLTVRHHRRDFAVLRTLGFTPVQTARTVRWQAGTLAVWGAIIGVPIGLVLGRLAWAAVARSYGIADDVAWPRGALILVLPVSVLLAIMLAWWPGRRAARIHPARVLRSE